MKAFSKVLIANRGEIACRIVKTLKNMNIKSVVMYSNIDHNAPHVLEADEAYPLNGDLCQDSYLNEDKVFDIIQKSGADAVHPGYGFFSENAKFAKRIESEGIVFIGPSSKIINLMGDKINSKKVAKESGVSIAEGYLGTIDSDKHALEIANNVGYPIILKASAGGGGRGIRVCYSDEDLLNDLPIVKTEALNSFKDDSLFIERYIERPRHIEIQVVADKFGNVLCLGERECSIQRRYQKIIEEAPSCFVTKDVRKEMYKQVKNLVSKIGYYSAGTVEFLMDHERNFFFSEMNTRIQVEHPVTELVTGFDIIKQMIEIAQGKELLIKQKDVKIKGAAIEARVYAEDPYNCFAPTRGLISNYAEPDSVRIDSAVNNGCEVSVFYDPMIAKVCTYGSDRESAIKLMNTALNKFSVGTLINNITFLQEIVNHKKFKDGDLHTGFLDEIFPSGVMRKKIPLDTDIISKLMFVCVAIRIRNILKDSDVELASLIGDWYLIVDDEHLQVSFLNLAKDGVFSFSYDDKKYDLIIKSYSNYIVNCCLVGHKDVAFKLFKGSNNFSFIIEYDCLRTDIMTLQKNEFDALDIVKNNVADSDLSNVVSSPMCGLIKNIYVKSGDSIDLGQPLFVIEAMKSLNSFTAEKSGIVEEVCFKEGELVSDDDVIIRLQ
ncbi:ATP-grasp domain-containing protein [Anaplasmataceae bacterium AB001_6]|nr:ATP-grasp domain-containing protein [Anaplasmataceae bacterium AB001_6]